MFLTAHSAVAVAASAWTGNPTVAFAVGVLSHYVMDAVPHGDEAVGRWALRDPDKTVRRLAAVMAVDLVILASACLWFVSRHGFSFASAAAVLGACLPDFMWGLETLAHRRIFGPLGDFHTRNHRRFRVEMPLWLGLIFQMTLAGTLWYLLGR
jgi:hypothetical protein